MFAAATATIAFALVFSYRTERAEEILVNKSYYFLVAAEECSESCLAEAFLSGGAGVELRTESGEYAVLACYAGSNGKEEAQEAQKTFSDLKKEETMIVPRGFGTIYLRTREQKRRKNEITGILNTLDGCADALYFAAKAAENGEMGQSALKETAKSTALVCSALAKSITGKDGASNRVCEGFASGAGGGLYGVSGFFRGVYRIKSPSGFAIAAVLRTAAVRIYHGRKRTDDASAFKIKWFL